MSEALDPWEVIRAAFPEPPKPPPPARPVTVAFVQPGNAYGSAALAAEVQRVMDAPKGTRNDELNKAAFNLGQLVGGGVLDELDVVDALRSACDASGYTADDGIGQVMATIRSGMTDGEMQPRGVPARPEVDVDSWLATLGPASGQDPADDPEAAAAVRSEAIRKNLPVLDWHALWADESEEEWIVEPLLPARRLVALYSAPKVGKSLLMLELAVAMVTGRDVLGVRLDRPRNVLYVDFENDPKADVRERLQALQVGPDDLARLHYLSFPTLASLDSDRGGQELMAAVAEYECEVVVVDTVSRAIAGEENENDTWLNFYRHTGLRMKQAGTALIRLDHSGKDESKGQRGGSAKSGDVDAVWRLSRVADDTYRLDCEAARMPITEKVLVLHRESTPLRHRVEGSGISAAISAAANSVVKLADEAGLPHDAGRPTLAKFVRSKGARAGTKALDEAVRIRSNRPYGAVPESRGQVPLDGLSPNIEDSSGTGGPDAA